MARGEIRLLRPVDRQQRPIYCFFGCPRSSVAGNTIHDAMRLEVAPHGRLRFQAEGARQVGKVDDHCPRDFLGECQYGSCSLVGASTGRLSVV